MPPTYAAEKYFLAACVSVCVWLFGYLNAFTQKHFSMQVYLDHIKITFEYEDGMVKVTLTK